MHILENIHINEDELHFEAVRASGPGGQHVNKTSSKIILRFDVTNSQSLSPDQKQMIITKLGSRIDKEGVLSLSSQESRSQLMNKSFAIERFVMLLRAALTIQKIRKPTKTPYSAKRKRLELKSIRSKVKSLRRSKPDSGE